MYSNKTVACVKVNGKILREQGNLVTLPFGSEYSVLIKNLNSVRIKLKVTVDGQDATDGCWLIVDPNTSLELERFIKDGNLQRGNRFKFIERTEQIEEHRGVGASDGLIRVEYFTEKAPPKITQTIHYDHHYHHPFPTWPIFPPGRRYTDRLGTCQSTQTNTSGASESEPIVLMAANMASFVVDRVDTANPNLGGHPYVAPVNDMGITVPGSESNQSFVRAAGFETHPTSDVIVLQLRGAVAGKRVEQPVTTDHKPKCGTCGQLNGSWVKFCGRCGTALEVI